MSIITVKKTGGDYSTVDAANQAANNGDTINVYPGTYQEQSVDVTQYPAGFVVVKNAITIQAVGAVTLMPSNPQTAIVLVKQGVTGGATIRGFTITGLGLGTGDGTTVGNDGILLHNDTDTSQSLIELCTITLHPYTGIEVNSHTKVQYCHINHCGSNVLHHGIYLGAEDPAGAPIFQFNDINNMSGAGIHAYYGEYNVKAIGNLLWANATNGLLLTGQGHTVSNNVMAGNGYGFYAYNGMVGWTVKNNIAWGNTTTDWFANVITPSGGAFDYNCYGTIQDQSVGGVMVGTHDLNADPKFIVASPAVWSDYRLQCNRNGNGSPCRAAGIAVAGVPAGLDPGQLILASKNWGAGRDMGAFVYG